MGHHGGVAVSTSPAPTWTFRQRVVLAVLLGTGLLLIIAGLGAAKTGDDDVRITDPAIERLIPKPGDLVLRQGEVGIDLAPGYTGELQIDGKQLTTHTIGQTDTPSPFDQNFDVQFDAGQATLLFTPRVGADIETFSPGRHTITARYWRTLQSRNESRVFTWQFAVS